MALLHFDFHKQLSGIEIKEGLRFSFWLEEGDYLMPCEFIRVSSVRSFYNVEVKFLDPSNFIDQKLLGRRFLFGHPGKIVGYGTLKEIAS